MIVPSQFAQADGDVAVGLGAAEVVERVGHCQPVPLARFALAARLDGEEARDAFGDGDEVGGVVEHDEARRAESAPGLPHRVVARGRVEQLDRQDRIGDAGDGSDDPPVVAGATTDLLDDLADRCAHRELGDTGAAGVAADRAHDRSR